MRLAGALSLLLASLAAGLPAAPLVLLDPGHGGEDPGVSSGDLIEAAVAMDVAQKLQAQLKAQGVDVRLSHAEGQGLPVSARVLAANASGADLYLSLHVNQHFNPSTHGPRVFTPKPRAAGAPAGPLAWEQASQARAEESLKLGQSLAKALGIQGPKPVQHLRLAQFRGLALPGALVELGFASHPETLKALMDEAGRRKLAEALAQGLVDYLAKGGRFAPPASR